MKNKIGIPRGMLYHEYSKMWESFFVNLDLEVVTSPETNADILNSGVSLSVDEACLPVKIYHGHVEYLKDKVDYIFMPRVLSLYKKEYCCPKILGLPAMIENSVENLPKIIQPTLKYEDKKYMLKTFSTIGKMFSNNNSTIRKAYKDAQNQLKEYRDNLLLEIPTRKNKSKNDKLNILILGHNYVIHDRFLNMDIVEKIGRNDIGIILPEYVSEKDYRDNTDQYKKRIFWTHGRIIIGGANYLIENKLIDGIIYISSFGCGMDSALLYMVEQKSIDNNIPMMELVLDEQTGDAGFNTRIEAFVDLLKWRYRIEDNFPAFR